jgi:hypothetical protein
VLEEVDAVPREKLETIAGPPADLAGAEGAEGDDDPAALARLEAEEAAPVTAARRRGRPLHWDGPSTFSLSVPAAPAGG